MTKPDLMAELAAYELVMVSGVSPDNNFRYGLFRSYEQAEAVGKLLLKADAEDHPEWCGYMIDRTHHAELEAVVRKAARYDWLNTHRLDFIARNNMHEPHVVLPVGADLMRADALDNAIDEQMHNSAREG